MTGYYTTPQFTEITDLLGYANLYTGNIFVALGMFALWIILFSWFKRYETKTAFAGATAITMVLAMPLSAIKFQGSPILNPNITIALIILTAVSALILWKTD